MPKPFFRTLVEFLILFTFSVQVFAQLTVSANRTQYSPKDSILLKVESSNPSESILDTSPLQSQFLILDQKKMMINSYAEGKRSSVARWELQLRAKKSGYIDIPVLNHNQESSEQFSVFIKSSSRTRFLPVSDQPIILDAQLNSDDNYEGALFLYTLNIYSDLPFADGFQISPPKIAQANVQFLDQSEIQNVEIRNKQYSVLEQRYAIYPAEMGRYVIEGPVFNGAQEGLSQIQVRANNLEINVRARQDFENANYWLPANNITIKESWKKSNTLRVGDTVVREVTLSAQGIPSANLPSLISTNSEIVNVKETSVALTDTINKQGIQGTRTETQYIQLLERGEVTFPEIQIFWWNTVLDSQEQAVINKQILQVLAGANGESSIEREVAQNKLPNNTDAPIRVIETDINWLLWAMIGLTLITSLGWIYNLKKMKNIREGQLENFETQPANNSVTDTTETQPINSFDAKAELDTFQLLGRACFSNDLPTSERLLIDWGKQFWYEQDIRNIEDVSYAANDLALNISLTEMQDLLAMHNTDTWDGKELFNQLTDIRDK
jgi:hypothetical protein